MNNMINYQYFEITNDQKKFITAQLRTYLTEKDTDSPFQRVNDAFSKKYNDRKYSFFLGKYYFYKYACSKGDEGNLSKDLHKKPDHIDEVRRYARKIKFDGD
jgi:hypothetical protein